MKSVRTVVLQRHCTLSFESNVLLPARLPGKIHACPIGRWSLGAHGQTEQYALEIFRADSDRNGGEEGWYHSG